MRILRHERPLDRFSVSAETARRHWRDVFGPASLPYPDTYRRARDRRFVQHLGRGMRRHIRRGFAGPLPSGQANSRVAPEYLAAGVCQIADSTSGEDICDVAAGHRSNADRGTSLARPDARQHYEHKLARYRMPRLSGADELLLKVFTDARRGTAPKAVSVLRECAIRPSAIHSHRSFQRVSRTPGAR